MGRPAKQQDPPDFREATDEQILAYVEDVYKQGYQAGLKAARPALPLFEQALRSVLGDIQLTQTGALDRAHVQQVIAGVEAEYGEKLIEADKRLIEQNAERDVAVERARSTQALKPRAIKPSERHQVKQTEYEVVR